MYGGQGKVSFLVENIFARLDSRGNEEEEKLPILSCCVLFAASKRDKQWVLGY